MRLGLFRRFVAAFSVVWLTLLLAEVPGLHACAVHSPASTIHSHSAAQHGHDHSSGTNTTHKGQCSCLGEACCAFAMAPDRQPQPVAINAPVIVQQPVSPKPGESLPCTPEFTIPFSNGPPASPSAQLVTAA